MRDEGVPLLGFSEVEMDVEDDKGGPDLVSDQGVKNGYMH